MFDNITTQSCLVANVNDNNHAMINSLKPLIQPEILYDGEFANEVIMMYVYLTEQKLIRVKYFSFF